VIKLTLYTTSACHLCELAEQQLVNITKAYDLDISQIEISHDDTLIERYGIRIPVIKFANGDELNWPFEQADIEEKLQ
jgi:hypothetical protein